MTEETFVKLDEVNLVVEDEKTVRIYNRYLQFYLKKYVGKKNTRFIRWKISKTLNYKDLRRL